MDRESAMLLLRSFVGRLVEDPEGFRLPEGRVSLDEVNAFRALSGLGLISRTDAAGSKMNNRGGPTSVGLDLSSIDLEGPPEQDLRICLDFGTAMSKAWATGASVQNTVPLILGRYAGVGDTPTVPSSIFISSSGRIFIGPSAETQHRQELGGIRERFDNLKRMLSEAEIDQDLDHVALPPGIDPTDSGLTRGDLLILYLAWLTDVSLSALSDMITDGSLEVGLSAKNLRAVKRRFAIPCFADAIDETLMGVGRASWAEGVLRRAVQKAQVVADTLREGWETLTVEHAKSVIDGVHYLEADKLPNVLADFPAVREPIAAGASLFDQELDELEVGEQSQRRDHLLVVDAGAGTTDFALFQVFSSKDEDYRYALIRPSVSMSRVAGNAVDEVLWPIVLKACGIDPGTGAPRSDEDFVQIKRDLKSKIRRIKEELFDGGRVEVSLVPNARGTITVNDLVDDSQYKSLGGDLKFACRSVLENIFSEESVEVFRRRSQNFPIHVLITGGSSVLPIVNDLGENPINAVGVTFSPRRVPGTPNWIEVLPRELAELIARAYPQTAVAIGGSAPELPIELDDLNDPITPAPRGKRKLERYQVTGVG